MLFRLALLLILAGCSEAVSVPRPRPDPEQALAQTPAPRTYRYAEGELKVFEVPIRAGRMVDRQTCILWRDSEFRTASLQCPSDGSDAGPIPGESKPSHY